MPKAYVVWTGHQRGVFETWAECQKATAGFPGAKYKSFPTLEEAKAAYNPQRPPAVKKTQATTQNKGPQTLVHRRASFPIQIYSDGACDPNPGPGASAVIVLEGLEVLETWIGGYLEQSTNNSAELCALEFALRRAQEFASFGRMVEVLSDSSYSLQAVFAWAESWERRGWTKRDGDIANLSQIKSCYALSKELSPLIQVTHVEAHVGVLGNELADQAARRALDNQVSAWVMESQGTPQGSRQQGQVREGNN